MAESVNVHDKCSDEVKDLVEHIWREAMTEVTAVLGDISSIRLEHVSLLMQVAFTLSVFTLYIRLFVLNLCWYALDSCCKTVSFGIFNLHTVFKKDNKS